MTPSAAATTFVRSPQSGGTGLAIGSTNQEIDARTARGRRRSYHARRLRRADRVLPHTKTKYVAGAPLARARTARALTIDYEVADIMQLESATSMFDVVL